MKRDGYYLIAIAALIGVLFFTYDRWQKTLEDSRHKDSIIAEKTNQIRYYKNENGRIVAEKSAALASIKEVKDAYPKLAEELKRDFDVKLKNMKAYIRNEFESRGSGIASITNNYYDTATNRTYRKLEFNDGYLAFESFIDSTKAAMSKYTYSDTITTVIHSKKKWVFGNERLYSSTALSNPNAKTTETTNILVDSHRDKRWVVSAGVFYSPFPKAYGLSLNFGYALIKF